MILFLYGQDSFRLHQRLQVLKQGFIKKYDQAGLNVEILYGINLSLDDFRKAALTWGLLKEKRLVLVKNVFENKSKNLLDELNELLKDLSEDNVIIFTAEKMPKGKSKLLNKLKKSDKVEEFKPLKGVQLNQWLRTKVQKAGATINRDAGNYLLDVYKDDLWSLNNEVDKLASYQKDITLESVQQLVGAPVDENIFNFTDALGNKDARLALKLLHDQLALGANEFYLLTMLARQIKILWQVKQTKGQGLDLHPFVIKKAMAQIRKFSLPQLKQLYQKLLDIDLKLKTTSVSPNTLLDLWVVEACQ